MQTGFALVQDGCNSPNACRAYRYQHLRGDGVNLGRPVRTTRKAVSFCARPRFRRFGTVCRPWGNLTGSSTASRSPGGALLHFCIFPSNLAAPPRSSAWGGRIAPRSSRTSVIAFAERFPPSRFPAISSSAFRVRPTRSSRLPSDFASAWGSRACTCSGTAPVPGSRRRCPTRCRPRSWPSAPSVRWLCRAHGAN